MVRFQLALTTTLWMAEVVASSSSVHNYQNARPRTRRRLARRRMVADPNDVRQQRLVPLWNEEEEEEEARDPRKNNDIHGNNDPDVGILSEAGPHAHSHRHRHLQEEASSSCDGLYGCDAFNCNSQAYQEEMGCDFSQFDNVTATGIITGCSYMFCKDCGASSDDPGCRFCALYSFKVGCGSGGSYTIEYQGELACATWPTVCAATYTGTTYFASGIQNETDVPTTIKTNVDNTGSCSVDVLGITCSDTDTTNGGDPAAIFNCPGGGFRAQLDSCDEEFNGFPFRPTLCSTPRALSNITGKQICAFKGEVQASASSVSTAVSMWSLLAVVTSSMWLLRF